MKNKMILFRLAILCLIISMAYSCKKEKRDDMILSATDQWILDSMRVYYYWADQLPLAPAPNSSANVFFRSLLNKADRFSYLDDPGENRTDYSSFAWYGFEYAFVRSNAFPDRMIGTITLVVPGGPAARSGLKRGDLFTAVNGTEISTGTSEFIKQILVKGDGVRLKLAFLENNLIKDGQDVQISYFRFVEQPVYTTRVFSDGTKKTGYVFYNSFNGNYDRNILDSLNKLRSSGMSELILDLRYDPGGDVSSVAKIAATLTTCTAGQTFVIYQANSNGGRMTRTFQDLISENAYQPRSFAELESRRANLNRLFILTSGATASAAELLINALKPFIEVVQIGQPTTGKDMASFAIDDQRKPKMTDLVLHPLVFKLYNARGQGDYSSGINPDHTIDEFSELPLRPFGSSQDAFIKKALELIYGNAIGVATINEPLKKTLTAGSLYESTIDRSRSASQVLTGHFLGSRFKRRVLPLKTSRKRSPIW